MCVSVRAGVRAGVCARACVCVWVCVCECVWLCVCRVSEPAGDPTHRQHHLHGDVRCPGGGAFRRVCSHAQRDGDGGQREGRARRLVPCHGLERCHVSSRRSVMCAKEF